MKSIYIDMDDVLCETCEALVRVASAHFGRHIAPDDMHDYDLRKSFGFDEQTYRDYMLRFHHNELEDLAPAPGALDVIRKWLRAGLRPVIVTGRPTYSNPATLRWLAKHGLDALDVLHVDKYGTLFNADADPLIVPFAALKDMGFAFAIDDAPHAVALIEHMQLCPYALFDRPWNRTPAHAGTLPHWRVTSWHEIDTIADTLFAELQTIDLS